MSIDISGKYVKDCKIFAETLENEAMSTIYSICNHPAFEGAKIRIMPDCHQGKGIVIGFTCPVGEYVNPDHIGVDIGCQMTSMVLDTAIPEEIIPEFEHKVKKAIPTGFAIHDKKMYDDKEFFSFLNREYNKARSMWPEMICDVGRIDGEFIEKMCSRLGMDLSTFIRSIGTLGGGNHFMEYGENDKGQGFFTVHCGSRNFGVKVATYWTNIGKRGGETVDMYQIAADVKASCPDKTQWGDRIRAAVREAIDEASIHAGYVSEENLKGYLSDMVIAQAYAAFNHITITKIVSKILKNYNINIADTINTVHNYISFEDKIIRKGAIMSYENQLMIIPFNMRDGLAICRGKSNDDWNCSAPHGAGRVMSRSAAKANIYIEDFKKSMEGIYSTSVGMGTLDESPMAYKDANEIIKLIEPTAEILYFVKPKINIKASDSCD